MTIGIRLSPFVIIKRTKKYAIGGQNKIRTTYSGGKKEQTSSRCFLGSL